MKVLSHKYSSNDDRSINGIVALLKLVFNKFQKTEKNIMNRKTD